MKRVPLSYSSSGVSYDVLDSFKRLAQKEGAKTKNNATIAEVVQSRGESAYVWEEKDCYRALVTEGLGTKNLVADDMRAITGKTYYDAIAQDTVAMIVNDLIVVGAAPQVINAYFAVGDSQWFSDTKRVNDLVRGWSQACKKAGAVWGGGETPTLKGIVESKTIDLAGTAIGIVNPKKNLVIGESIQDGDDIVLIESSGIHANGLSLARAIAQKLKSGYATKMEDGKMFGEALLTPTHIYAKFVAQLLEAGVDVHYMVNVTGHGWRKLMRATGNFSYIIETVPAPQPVFGFMQKISGNDDREMYATFNMGVGFAVYVPKVHTKRVQQIARKNRLKSWEAGKIVKGKKQVIIKPKNIVYTSESLQVR
jgi:phosphoribosylformylglycinamidine cyclo-ligase